MGTETGPVRGNTLQGNESSAGTDVEKSAMALAEGATAHVLPREAHRAPLGEYRGKGQGLGIAPVYPFPRAQRLKPLLQERGSLGMGRETGGDLRQLLAESQKLRRARPRIPGKGRIAPLDPAPITPEARGRHRPLPSERVVKATCVRLARRRDRLGGDASLCQFGSVEVSHGRALLDAL